MPLTGNLYPMRGIMRRCIFIISVLTLLVCVGVVSTPTASADDLTFTAAADATVRANQPNTNFGTATTLAVDGEPTIRSYLRFDVTGLTSAPYSAVLKVFTSSSSTTGISAAATDAAGWTETGVTYNNAPPPGATIGSSGTITSGTYFSIDVTSAVTADGSYGFVLSTASTTSKTFSSREAPNPPQLVVTPDPPPLGQADSTVRADQPSTNFGSTSTLVVDGSPIVRSYLRFVVTGVTQPVTTVTLRLFSKTTSTSTIVVRSVTDPTWGETTITYANAPAIGPVIGSSPVLTAGAYVSVDLTGAVTGDGLYSFALETTSASSKSFASRESATPPQLIVDTTPPAAGTVVAVGGDVACSPSDSGYNGGAGTATRCHQRYTSDLVLNMQPAAVFALGDLQYTTGSLTNFNTVYDPTWGRFKDITKPAVGNHEYGTSGASGYFRYFGDLATPMDPGCRSNCRGYYSFDIGNWHVIALNTNCDQAVADCAAGSPQEQWLRADLAAHPNQCTVALMHHPLWGTTSLTEPRVRPLVQALYDFDADLILAAHGHFYERFAPQNPAGAVDNARGIRQLIVGTGGAFFNGSGSPVANSEVLKREVFGVLKLTLSDAGYNWRFIADPATPFGDTGSGTCH